MVDQRLVVVKLALGDIDLRLGRLRLLARLIHAQLQLAGINAAQQLPGFHNITLTHLQTLQLPRHARFDNCRIHGAQRARHRHTLAYFHALHRHHIGCGQLGQAQIFSGVCRCKRLALRLTRRERSGGGKTYQCKHQQAQRPFEGILLIQAHAGCVR